MLLLSDNWISHFTVATACNRGWATLYSQARSHSFDYSKMKQDTGSSLTFWCIFINKNIQTMSSSSWSTKLSSSYKLCNCTRCKCKHEPHHNWLCFTSFASPTSSSSSCRSIAYSQTWSEPSDEEDLKVMKVLAPWDTLVFICLLLFRMVSIVAADLLFASMKWDAHGACWVVKCVKSPIRRQATDTGRQPHNTMITLYHSCWIQLALEWWNLSLCSMKANKQRRWLLQSTLLQEKVY